MKSDRFVFAVIFALVFSMITLSLDSFAIKCQAVRGETLRLHIMAASDSEKDQQNKLAVRDAVLEQYSDILCGKDIEQAKYLADFLKDDIKQTAENTLKKNGCNDGVSVELTDMFFDTRSYQNAITLPAGEYSALRIIIGEGKGQNWWCVMYPPLCLSACVKDEAMQVQQSISELGQQPAYRAKFAIVELMQNIAAATNKS